MLSYSYQSLAHFRYLKLRRFERRKLRFLPRRVLRIRPDSVACLPASNEGREKGENVGKRFSHEPFENLTLVPLFSLLSPSPSNTSTTATTSRGYTRWINHNSRLLLKCQNTSLSVWSKINTSSKSSQSLSPSYGSSLCRARGESETPCSDLLHELSLFSSPLLSNRTPLSRISS